MEAAALHSISAMLCAETEGAPCEREIKCHCLARNIDANKEDTK